MKTGLKLAIGICGVVFIVSGAAAGDVGKSRLTMAVSSAHTHTVWRAAQTCQRVCTSTVNGRCVQWGQSCSGGGAVRG